MEEYRYEYTFMIFLSYLLNGYCNFYNITDTIDYQKIFSLSRYSVRFKFPKYLIHDVQRSVQLYNIVIFLLDKLGSNIEIPQIFDENDGWVDVQEDEDEAKWSKLRQERDKFLEERMVRNYYVLQ